MREFLLILGSVYGGLSVLFGAFGAHALKSRMNEELQKSFETGVRYQMYHALILILTGIIFDFSEGTQLVMGWCFVVGTFLFSFSIYGLTLSSSAGKKIKFLGPVTPLGGLLLLIGWGLLTYNFVTIEINF